MSDIDHKARLIISDGIFEAMCNHIGKQVTEEAWDGGAERISEWLAAQNIAFYDTTTHVAIERKLATSVFNVANRSLVRRGIDPFDVPTDLQTGGW